MIFELLRQLWDDLMISLIAIPFGVTNYAGGIFLPSGSVVLLFCL